MKKTGFTLTEVLITLGIVGVVAAITLPTLSTSTSNAQIGPKLAKAVTVFEQANAAMLAAEGVDSIQEAGLWMRESNHANKLNKHMKIVKIYASDEFQTKDGIFYRIVHEDTTINTTYPTYKQKIGYVFIDINGLEGRPNQDGTDRFYFYLSNDGSLTPYGSTGLFYEDDKTWKDKCRVGVTPEDARYCAGHIFENNLKVLYQ